MIYFLREFGMFVLSFNSNVVFEVIWQISGKGLLRITRYTCEITVNEAAHTISLILPSKSSFNFNTSNSDPTSFVLNERETTFASGMERDHSDLSQSIWHQEIVELQARNFGSMDCTINDNAVNHWCSSLVKNFRINSTFILNNYSMCARWIWDDR